MMGTVSELCASSFQTFLCPTARPAATQVNLSLARSLHKTFSDFQPSMADSVDRR